MFRDRIDIDQASLLPAYHTKHVPVCLHAARAVDTAIALSYEPAEEAYKIPDVELMKGLLVVGVYRGEVPNARINDHRSASNRP